MAFLETQKLNEYDSLVYITEQCIKKGHDMEAYNAKISQDECEICKLQHFAYQVALVDSDILDLLCAFEFQFWGNNISCKSSYRELINMHLNFENVHVLSLA